MKRRIFGLENEYGLTCTLNGQRRLSPDNVARYLFEKVLQTPRGFHYCLSQRAQHICQEISGATTSSRSIINTRDEPHADAERYRRLHVIVGDSNMSEVATYLKIGTTALVLDMIEDGFFDRDYSLQSPVQAIRDISHDPTLREAIKLKDGRSITALQMQLEYLGYATGAPDAPLQGSLPVPRRAGRAAHPLLLATFAPVGGRQAGYSRETHRSLHAPLEGPDRKG